MARNVRFSLNRFLFHNKTLIFLTVLIITVLLILQLQTKNPQSSYRNHARTYSNQLQLPYFKNDLDAYYKQLLDVHSSNSSTNIPCDNAWIIAAIPGFDIEDYVWEYISLIAITEVYGENEGLKLNAYLSKRTMEDLEKLFER